MINIIASKLILILILLYFIFYNNHVSNMSNKLIYGDPIVLSDTGLDYIRVNTDNEIEVPNSKLARSNLFNETDICDQLILY